MSVALRVNVSQLWWHRLVCVLQPETLEQIHVADNNLLLLAICFYYCSCYSIAMQCHHTTSLVQIDRRLIAEKIPNCWISYMDAVPPLSASVCWSLSAYTSYVLGLIIILPRFFKQLSFSMLSAECYVMFDCLFLNLYDLCVWPFSSFSVLFFKFPLTCRLCWLNSIHV